MILNIDKLQSGGRVYFSATQDPSAAPTTATESSSSSSKKSDDDIFTDKMKADLMDKALPNDYRKLMGMMYKLEQSDFGSGVNRSLLYQIRSYANQAIKQAEFLKKADEEALKNDAWGEVAVDPNGYLYVIDEKGAFSKVSINKFNIKKHQALTVGQLSQYRKEVDTLVDRSDITTTIGNSVGMEKISSFIKSIIDTIGKSSTSREAYQDLASIVGQYNKRISDAEFQAIQGIANEFDKLGPSAIFKLKAVSENKNLEAGLKYILSVLPPAMRHTLEGRWVASGGDPKKSGDYAANVIINALEANNDNKTQLDIDYNTGINKAAGNVEDKSPKTHNLTMMEVFFNGDINYQREIEISSPNSKNQTELVVQGTVIPSLVTDDGKSISDLPLSVALSGAGMGKYLNKNKIWVGDQQVSEGMLQNIAYLNDQVANVWLPVDYEGNIDWRAVQSFTAAEKQIKEEGVTDPIKKNKIHAQNGSSVRYGQDGTLSKLSRVGQFALTFGYTIDDHINSRTDFVEELTGDIEDQVANRIDAIYNKKLKQSTGISGIDSQQAWDDIIRVPVFIKVQPNAAQNAAINAGYGPQVDNQTLEQSMLTQQQQNPTFTAGGAELYEDYE